MTYPDGTALVWLHGLSHSQGYDLQFHPKDKPSLRKRVEQKTRVEAEMKWAAKYGDRPRSEKVDEFDVFDGRYLKRVWWTPE